MLNKNNFTLSRISFYQWVICIPYQNAASQLFVRKYCISKSAVLYIYSKKGKKHKKTY